MPYESLEKDGREMHTHYITIASSDDAAAGTESLDLIAVDLALSFDISLSSHGVHGALRSLGVQ